MTFLTVERYQIYLIKFEISDLNFAQASKLACLGRQAYLPGRASLPAWAGKLACLGKQARLPGQASSPAWAGKLACLAGKLACLGRQACLRPRLRVTHPIVQR